MKKINTLWLSAAICAAAMLSGQNALAETVYVDDNVFIEDFSIAPGQTVPLTLWMDNTCTWKYACVRIDLPEGLVVEKINPDELDNEAFTIHYLTSWDSPILTTDYVALSTVFTDESYRTNSYNNELKSYKMDDLETIAWVFFAYTDSGVGMDVINDCLTAHFGVYPFLQLRVRATKDLADNAVITTRVAFIGNALEVYEGPDIYNQFDGTPKECRVRRVDTPAYNADVNADGVVDIDDVNIVISTMLGK